MHSAGHWIVQFDISWLVLQYIHLIMHKSQSIAMHLPVTVFYVPTIWTIEPKINSSYWSLYCLIRVAMTAWRYLTCILHLLRSVCYISVNHKLPKKNYLELNQVVFSSLKLLLSFSVLCSILDACIGQYPVFVGDRSYVFCCASQLLWYLQAGNEWAWQQCQV